MKLTTMRNHSLRITKYVRTLVALASLGAVGCSASDDANEALDSVSKAAGPATQVDSRRSLAITDQPTLANFTLERVLNQLISTSGVTGQSAKQLFQQWWDTQNPGPGLGLGPHCDDGASGGNPTLNGYPYTCRPAPGQEGYQAACDPFAGGSPCAYIPIGLFMRFDLAPADGSNCGEYRVIFAKATGKTTATDRNLVIFEASVDNPLVQQGLAGCERLVRAWANLSLVGSATARRTQLEGMYFSGYQNFSPIIHAKNFGDNAEGLGQVRTNQFVQAESPRIWSLREFQIKKICDAAGCVLRFVPVTNKVNPFGPLFSATSADPRAAAFQNAFIGELTRLAATTISGVGMNVADEFNSGQSQANGSSEMDYPAHFGPLPSTFSAAIEAELARLGSSLLPLDIVRRAQAMSCAGCHRLSNSANLGGGLIWPPSLGFVHVSERDADLETVNGVTRFRISDALANHFLPHRKQLVEDYLDQRPLPPRAPRDPIGGRFTH